MLKKFGISAALIAFFALFASDVCAAEDAALLSNAGNMRVTGSYGQALDPARIADDNWNTKIDFDLQGSVTLQSEGDIHFLYIVWDRPPAPWLLTQRSEGRTLGTLCGKQGFLHEYVALREPSKSVTVVTPAGGSSMCDIFAYGEGAIPAKVQLWQEPCEDADMLLLPTHADDEYLFFGGTIPLYAAELGFDVQVAYLTNHWAEPYRPHELLKGLWTAGMTRYPVVSAFEDLYSESLEHAKTLWDLSEIEAYEVMLLRRFKPEVVIGHDRDGEYGHGAHMLNSWVLRQAVERAADPEWRADESAAPGSYLEEAKSLQPFAVSKLYLHLWPENKLVMNWTEPLEAFGGRTALDMAKEAFACHASQKAYFSVRTDGVYDCRAFGLCYSSAGPDVQADGPDFFEHIDESAFSDYAAPEMPSADKAAKEGGGASEEASGAHSSGKERAGAAAAQDVALRRSVMPEVFALSIAALAGLSLFLVYRNAKKH